LPMCGREAAEKSSREPTPAQGEVPHPKNKRLRARKLIPLGLFGIVCLAYWATTLWGIDAQFTWGHYGYNAGYHGANARNFLRHGVLTPAHYVGRAPPPRSRYKLHHPISMYLYLAAAIRLFGEQEWVIRIVPAIFTFLALLALFWITRRLWNVWAALLASVVFVFLPQNLIFSQMMNYDPTAIFYTILATGCFVIWFEDGSWKAGAVAVIALALAGLVDWPPYVVAFVVALYGWGAVTAASRVGGRLDDWFPRGVAGTAAIIATAGAVHYALGEHTRFASEFELLFVLVVVLAMSMGAKSKRLNEDKWHRRGWVQLGLWGMVPIATLAFHFLYTWQMGQWEDVMASYDLRKSGALGESFLEFYRGEILELMYTKPLLLVGAVWFTLLPVRAVFDRLPPRTVIPLAFGAAQLFLNLKFPNEIRMHGYRAYHFSVFFPLAFADLAVFGASALRSLSADRSRWWWRLGAPAGVAACLLVFGWQVSHAMPDYRRSRHVGGTMNLKNYRPHRHKLRFFMEVNKLTSRDTFVVYRRFLRPRYEGLWYLDRDSSPVGRLPRSYHRAQRVAGKLFRRIHRPKPSPEAIWWSRFDSEKRRRRPPPKLERPVAGLGDLRHKSVRRSVRSLAKRYAVRIFGHFVCVLYDKKGPDLEAYRFTARRRTAVERYLRWRKWELLIRPSPGSTARWRKRLGLDSER
jgi:4-amino-4-deoxy-L-arabinose transferase-like glycosyltransferase